MELGPGTDWGKVWHCPCAWLSPHPHAQSRLKISARDVMGKRRESLITIPKRNATSEGPGGQLSAQCLMKNRRGKRGWSGRDMHVPPSAPMALLHVYEAAEPHHSTQPSHKLSHLLCLLRIEPSLPPSPCSSSMQEQNGRTLKAAGAASVSATFSEAKKERSARCCYRVPSSHCPVGSRT